DLGNVDRILLLVDAGLHAIVADPVAGRRRHRVVDAHQRQRGERVALASRGVHLGDALLQRTAGQRSAERILPVARGVLLLKTLGAGILLALVAVDAVIDLAARLARGHPGIGQAEAVAPALVLLASREQLRTVRARTPERDQPLEVEWVRQPQ